MNEKAPRATYDPDIKRSLDALTSEVGRVLREARRCCITCQHWDDFPPDGRCKLANARPPARTIAYGCPRYEQAEIPF